MQCRQWRHKTDILIFVEKRNNCIGSNTCITAPPSVEYNTPSMGYNTRCRINATDIEHDRIRISVKTRQHTDRTLKNLLKYTPEAGQALPVCVTVSTFIHVQIITDI